MTQHVAVLMGGWSAEREVSLVSGRACAKALRDRGYRVSEVDVDRRLAAVLEELAPDVAFNALHGPWGEDGCVQGLLEIMGIPYTHSGVRASALAMYKPAACDLFRRAGIRCPEGRVVSRRELQAGAVFDPPYVVKPLNEGSSVGVHIVMRGDNAGPPLDDDWPFGDEVMVERYIPGREIQVAMMGERALGAVEIRPKGRFYDYAAKYTEGLADHYMPAPIQPAMYDEALRIAKLAHDTLGCRGVSRADLRYDDTAGEPGQLFLLEINTQPGMTPLSLVPEIAGHFGISFGDIVQWLVEDAGCGR